MKNHIFLPIVILLISTQFEAKGSNESGGCQAELVNYRFSPTIGRSYRTLPGSPFSEYHLLGAGLNAVVKRFGDYGSPDSYLERSYTFLGMAEYDEYRLRFLYKVLSGFDGLSTPEVLRREGNNLITKDVLGRSLRLVLKDDSINQDVRNALRLKAQSALKSLKEHLEDQDDVIRASLYDLDLNIAIPMPEKFQNSQDHEYLIRYNRSELGLRIYDDQIVVTPDGELVIVDPG